MKADTRLETPAVSSKLAYRIKEAQAALGISRSTIYALLAEGKLRTVRVAGCRLILAEDIQRLLSGE